MYAIQKFLGVEEKDGISTKMGISPVGDSNGMIVWICLTCLFITLKGIGYPASQCCGNAHRTGLLLMSIESPQ